MGYIYRQLFMPIELAYVDDYNLIQYGKYSIELPSSMQLHINSWGSIIEVTGGAL